MIAKYEVLDERVIGEGGFLTLRRLRLRLLRDDGTRTKEGLYDFVERPMGRDAVVLALYCRREGVVEVLVRDGLRVPLHFGRPHPPDPPQPFTELVAGVLEKAEGDADDSVRERAAAEAYEEAGLTVDAAGIEILGAPTFPTPGMCAEQFRLTACEVPADARTKMIAPPTDGSPFEEGARLRWIELDRAIDDCTRGLIRDLKTEVTLRRLKDRLRGAHA